VLNKAISHERLLFVKHLEPLNPEQKHYSQCKPERLIAFMKCYQKTPAAVNHSCADIQTNDKCDIIQLLNEQEVNMK